MTVCPLRYTFLTRLVLLFALCRGGPTTVLRAAEAEERAVRRTITERALDYLVRTQKEGVLGDNRPRAVTALFILAALSEGRTPADEDTGPALTAASTWLLENTAEGFLGGPEEPRADHALASLAVSQLAGCFADPALNVKLHKRAAAALAHSLDCQDRGTDPRHGGGWSPNEKVRANDRVLTTWFLLQLRAGQLTDERLGRSSLERAVDFVLASQKGGAVKKPEEAGGFSVGADGLTVRSATAAGTLALAIFNPHDESGTAAVAWLGRHPPRWYGPHFFTTNFFAVRALWRLRDRDGGKSFRRTFARLGRFLRERQRSDGSIPFPPGHGGPIVSMGPAYATAMAILILNVDRGYLPIDQ